MSKFLLVDKYDLYMAGNAIFDELEMPRFIISEFLLVDKKPLVHKHVNTCKLALAFFFFSLSLFCFTIFDFHLSFCSTFFKQFHKGLAQTVKLLLKNEGSSEAIFFNPKRGDSLDKFLVEVKECGLRSSVDEVYDTKVWTRHQGFINDDDLWANYEKDHCYPLLARISL